jgi:hypothetical protein
MAAERVGKTGEPFAGDGARGARDGVRDTPDFAGNGFVGYFGAVGDPGNDGANLIAETIIQVSRGRMPGACDRLNPH